MKKVRILSLLCILLSMSYLFAATQYSTPFSQKVYGFVDSANSVSITLDVSIFPFDLLSDSVKRNDSENTVRGLKIGTISMNTNSDTFKLIITHDLLSKDDNGKKGSLDYRLDVFYGPGLRDFVIVTEKNRGATISKSSSSTVFASSPYVITERSIYVSMVDDAATLEGSDVPTGTYKSTITCTMTVDD